MGAMSRNKGKAGEREIASLLADLTGHDVKRRVRQRDGNSDLKSVQNLAMTQRKETAMLKRPTAHQRVIDVVAQSGIDVSDWANYSGPPASNPKYCYSWGFEKPGDFVLLNLLYDEIDEKDGLVVWATNYREFANKQDRNKKATWVQRALEVDLMLQKAWNDSLAVRVAICDGLPDSATVDRRYLDADTWAVTSYDCDTGACVLTRGVSPERYIDQHALPNTDTEGCLPPQG